MPVEMSDKKAASIGLIVALLLVGSFGITVWEFLKVQRRDATIRRKEMIIEEYNETITTYEEVANNLTSQVKELREKQERALVWFEFDEWGEMPDNPGNTYFEGTIYNAGNESADDVEVTCNIRNLTSPGHIFSKTKSIGGIGAHSMDSVNVFVTNRTFEAGVDEELWGGCYITSCNGGNCKNLGRGIPSRRKMINSAT